MDTLFGMDRKIAYAIALLVFAGSMAAALRQQYFTDADYGLLLKAGLSVENAGLVGAALLALLPLAAYLVSVYLLKADEFHALVAGVLFALSGALSAGIFALPPFLALFLGRNYGVFEAAKILGAVLPLGVLALAEYEKDRVNAALAALGIAALPFAPPVAALLLALAAAKGVWVLENAVYADRALVLAVFVFVFQQLLGGEILAALVPAVFLAAIAYIASALHNMKKDEAYALVFLFAAFGTLSLLFSVSQAGAGALTQDEISAFASAKGGGSFGVFDYQNAFRYYSGMEAELLNSSALLKRNGTLPATVVFSERAAMAAYADKPIFFAYAGSFTDSSGNTIVQFENGGFALRMFAGSNGLAVQDAALFNVNTREGVTVPFTKVKHIGPSSSYREGLMVNAQEIDGTLLYSLLFDSGADFSRSATLIRTSVG